MRFLTILAALALAGCPAPPENPSTAGGPPGGGAKAPPAGQQGGPGAKPGGEAGPANPGGEGGVAQGGEAGGPPPGGEGGPGLEGGPKEPGGPEGPPPEFEIEGEAVKISGNIIFPDYNGGTIVIEVLRNEEGINQPIRLHVLTLNAPGPYSFDAPKDVGEVNLIAYIGDAEQGPNPEVPLGNIDPINVTTEAISGVDITIVADRAGAKEADKPE
ncbi:MAG: hypothetical protein H6741_06255 [Alphaproteobacteria bacterium]|nr:hypothetical protein [Alphaproteobacteria bacterium]MCB9792312.1 hypothetical protein [Alphaproteobacteria bacterium]